MDSRLAMKLPRQFVPFLVFVFCLSPSGFEGGEPERTTPAAGAAMPGKEAGQVRIDNGLKMKLVWCPSGDFKMGSPASENGRGMGEDQVAVTLTTGYWLGKYEVTQGEWKALMGTEPWKGQEFAKEGNDFPATFVNWEDAVKFCARLSDQERQARRLPESWEYSLPTEAQWERACRAGTETPFCFGDDGSKLVDYAWFHDTTWKDRVPHAHRVGQKNPNLWFLYDMLVVSL